MREIFYNSDITSNSENEIKLLALYYDKINIVNDAVYYPTFSNLNSDFKFAGVESVQFIPRQLETKYKLLIDENIISITKREDYDDKKYENLFSKKISDFINLNHDYIFPNHPTEKNSRIITEEVYNIMNNMINFEWGNPIDTSYVWWYYAFKLKWFIKLLMEGKNCISSSNNLNYLFSSFVQEYTKINSKMGLNSYTRSLAFDALRINLPNPDILSFEDILELKIKMKDELELFSKTINSIEIRNKQLYDTQILDSEYKNILFTEIQKPLKDLEVKMKYLNSKTFRKFIDRMQNPKTYVPMIGTVVASLPMQYTLLVSLGLIAGQSYLEYQEEKREIINNGLYFLLKIK